MAVDDASAPRLENSCDGVYGGPFIGPSSSASTQPCLMADGVVGPDNYTEEETADLALNTIRAIYGDGGSRAVAVLEFSNDFENSKRLSCTIRQKPCPGCPCS
jgi:hypothetical protein